jgi:UDP-N-acetylmuramoyl-tripeptide--D-alanyl-D-alanine ligase
MDTLSLIIKELEACNFNASTDTRKDLKGSVFFALKGDNFDGGNFIEEALSKGAFAVVTENITKSQERVHIVENVLETLQKCASKYRELFTIPLIAIGGSNGKTTSKELLKKTLGQKYNIHGTDGSLNNHIGVPLSILLMSRNTEIGIFEIGANHPKEHLELLNILKPTHVVVTNNGMDHLEGFGSPEGSRLANKEIYDWAKLHHTNVFVHKKHQDLLEDSEGTSRVLYPGHEFTLAHTTPLSFMYKQSLYTTQMVGAYNIENIELAVSLAEYFKTTPEDACRAVCEYSPSSKRSQFLHREDNDFVVDCYNANPTSMKLSLESFLTSPATKKGVVLGDMLELGEYADEEHKKIFKYVLASPFSTRIFIGNFFKKALEGVSGDYVWFETSTEAHDWFTAQHFTGVTFLLKGSRGIQVEKILGL